jgi:protein TonB
VSAPPVAAAAIAAARPPGPVDLTGEVFISGEAAAPTGGPTARSGVERASPGIATRARPVSLEATRWRCPWPKQAEASDRDHETVLIRVVVAASGTARSVEVLRDPGSGFGAAAASCALATAFLPALAVDGAPIDATSPPILVRFDR